MKTRKLTIYVMSLLLLMSTISNLTNNVSADGNNGSNLILIGSNNNSTLTDVTINLEEFENASIIMIFGNVTIYDSPVTNLTQYIFSVNNTELENDTVIGVFNETTFVIGGYFNSSMFSVEYETQNETIYEQMLANLMNNESIMLNINTIVEIETTLNNTIDNDVDNDVNNTVVNSDENSNVNDNRDTVNIFFLQGRLTWDDPLSWVLIILASTLLVGAIIKTNVSRVKAKRNFRPSNEIGQSSKVKVELSDRATPLDKVLNNFWAKQRRANVNLVGVPSGKVKTVKFTGVGKEQPNRLAKNLDETIYYLDGTENF